MRREVKTFRLICDRCGVIIDPMVTVDDDGHLDRERTVAAEVWFSPPGGRGGVRWESEGELFEKRVTIYDSCNKCAAEAMDLIDEFYNHGAVRDGAL